MTLRDTILNDLTAGYRTNCSSGSLSCSVTSLTILGHHFFCVECTHPITRSSEEKLSFTFMNWLMKEVTCLGVSPLGYSCLTWPGNSPMMSLLLPVGNVSWFVIFSITMPCCILVSPYPSVAESTSIANKIGECVPCWVKRNVSCQFDEATCGCRQKDHRSCR